MSLPDSYSLSRRCARLAGEHLHRRLIGDRHVGQRRVCLSFVCVQSCTKTEAFAEQTMERGHGCKNNLPVHGPKHSGLFRCYKKETIWTEVVL